MILNKKQTYFILFMICIVSRIFTSIYYIEDIDSLRFALSLKEFDITRLQPHFPGYAVFYFFVGGRILRARNGYRLTI